MDGVLTDTRRLHQRAWAGVFESLLCATGSGGFTESDYIQFVDGRGRLDGIRTFLHSRGLPLREGTPADQAGLDSVHAVAAEKNRQYLALLEEEGVWTYPDVAPALDKWRRHGWRLGVLSGSRNANAVLEAAGLRDVFDAVVDGTDLDERHLPGKPAPEGALLLLERLGTSPDNAILCEDAAAGIAAGRAAGIGLLVGVVRGDEISSTSRALALRREGAHLVVNTLGEVPTPPPETT
ncbi:MAG: HAD-IA family hydrolase, partial [Myxococcota bacterium]